MRTATAAGKHWAAMRTAKRTAAKRAAGAGPKMAHEQLPDETPPRGVASPRVVRSSRLRVWALFASGAAVLGAVALTAAPTAAPAPAPADPSPPCANCNDVQIPPDVIARMPAPEDTVIVPPDFPFTVTDYPGWGTPYCGQVPPEQPCIPK